MVDEGVKLAGLAHAVVKVADNKAVKATPPCPNVEVGKMGSIDFCDHIQSVSGKLTQEGGKKKGGNGAVVDEPAVDISLGSIQMNVAIKQCVGEE